MVEVQGHTDAVGSAQNNMKLSYLRASAVRDYLIDKHDIDPTRLIPMGYGESRPIASNKTSAGRDQNRRVEFLLLKWYAKAEFEKRKAETEPPMQDSWYRIPNTGF